MTNRAIALAAACVAVLAAAVPAAATAAAAHGGRGDGLGKVRKATARFHSFEAALQAGYEPAGPCAEEPGMGAMGFHFVNQRLVADPHRRGPALAVRQALRRSDARPRAGAADPLRPARLGMEDQPSRHVRPVEPKGELPVAG
jgi:hypothetical protein